MSIVRKVGSKWTEPKTIYPDNWEIEACPVNGPRVAAIGNNLAVAWFSAPGNNGQVKVVFSDNGGESFYEPIVVDDGSPIGRVDLIMLSDSRAGISWLTQNEAGAFIKFAIINAKGVVEHMVTVSETSESRGSGFPQMERYKGKVYFAWTEPGEGTSTIKTAWIKL